MRGLKVFENRRIACRSTSLEGFVKEVPEVQFWIFELGVVDVLWVIRWLVFLDLRSIFNLIEQVDHLCETFIFGALVADLNGLKLLRSRWV